MTYYIWLSALIVMVVSGIAFATNVFAEMVAERLEGWRVMVFRVSRIRMTLSQMRNPVPQKR
jgi:hypothetical protein